MHQQLALVAGADGDDIAIADVAGCAGRSALRHILAVVHDQCALADPLADIGHAFDAEEVFIGAGAACEASLFACAGRLRGEQGQSSDEGDIEGAQDGVGHDDFFLVEVYDGLAARGENCAVVHGGQFAKRSGDREFAGTVLRGFLVSDNAQRWSFDQRWALAPDRVRRLLDQRAHWREELIGFRLGSADCDPLFVPDLSAIFLRAEDAKALGGLAIEHLRVDAPESMGAMQQVADCSTGALGPRIFAPQALGLDLATTAGDGVIVGVLDSGIDARHPDLRGRIAASAAFMGQGSVEDGSSDSHGTAAASIIAGARLPADGHCRYGIACEAQLVIGKVMHNSGRSDSFAMEIGAAWAIAAGAQILSISVGFDRARDAGASVLSRSLSRLSLRKRVLIVAAAGNGDPQRDGIKQPAAGREVLAIGATDLQGAVRHDSLRGDRRAGIFCVAPGANVACARRSDGGANAARGFFNGTSAAAAVVAGLAAVLKADCKGACAQFLRAELERRCRPLEVGNHLDFGAGALHA